MKFIYTGCLCCEAVDWDECIIACIILLLEGCARGRQRGKQRQKRKHVQGDGISRCERGVSDINSLMITYSTQLQVLIETQVHDLLQ